MMSLILALLMSAPIQDAAMDYIDESFGPNESQYELDYSEKCDLLGADDNLLDIACFIVQPPEEEEEL